MKRNLSLIPLLALLLFAASCSKTPDHASYIPKDAQVVFSLNTGALQKKLAWSFFTGSDMLKELRGSGADDESLAAVQDIQNAGLDFSSTLYLYTKSDTRYAGNTRVNALVPIADASKLKAFLQKHVSKARLSERSGHQVALTDDLSMAWNDKMLIVTNNAVRREQVQAEAAVDTIGGMEMPVEAYSYDRTVADTALTLSELDAAFTKPKESLLLDKRFQDLSGEGHDISLWLAYDQLMNTLRGQQGMGMFGAMSGSYWENTVLSAGVDFKDGEIVSQGKYFVSDSMRDIAKALSKDNVDAAMLQRLPAQGLNFAVGYHLNTDALKMMLDKMGLTALANQQLSQQGLSVEEILGAFTGDLVLSINNFRIERKMQEVDSTMRELYGMTPSEVKKPAMDLVFAMKVKDPAKAQKLVGFAANTGMLAATGPNSWTLANSPDGSVLMQDKDYLVAGSSQAVATTFVGGGGTMPPAVKQEISGHPYGMWADINSFITGIGTAAGDSPSETAAMNAVRGVFDTFTFNGGEFKGDASVFSMKLGFTNKKENSLLQLAQMIQRLNAASKARPVAMR